MQQLVAASLKQQQIQSPPLKLALFGGQLISREYKENFQKLFQVAIPYVSMRCLCVSRVFLHLFSCLFSPISALSCSNSGLLPEA